MKRGRKPADLSKTLDGIWWVLVTGAQWNQLPECYGKWNSVYRFHLRWAKRGLFKKLMQRLARRNAIPGYKVIDGSHVKVHQDACYRLDCQPSQIFGTTKGGRNTKLHAVVDLKGRPMDVILIPGQEAEVSSACGLLGNVRKTIVLADKGYDSDELRQEIFKAGGAANIAGRSNRKREVPYSKKIGKRRHVVENFFARIKRFRRVNTRYERLAETYLSFVHLASAYVWLR